MIIEIKTVFAIETRDLEVAVKLIKELSTGPICHDLKSSFARAVHSTTVNPKALDLNGPSFDIHRIHEPDIDGPKPDVSGEPDAIDPTVVIGDADGNSLKDKRREP